MELMHFDRVFLFRVLMADTFKLLYVLGGVGIIMNKKVKWKGSGDTPATAKLGNEASSINNDSSFT